MVVAPSLISAIRVMYPLLAGAAIAGSIADIEHVVLFMQENRAFDHYFGTMAGVRGFSDPNVQVNSGKAVWQQDVNSNLTTSASYLLPWYLNYQGGDFLEATQCMVAGDNGWQDNHAALNGGLNNHWATNNTPWSWGHYRRSDIPVQFGIADGWTVGDMYQESIISSTNPNRVVWASGSINVPGSPQTESEGGYPYIDNNETPGCETGGFNCYPLSWKTAAEHYQDANVSWDVFQDADNFDDNPLAWFKQFQDALPGSQLNNKGMVGSSLDDFYARAANGTLPAVSYIIGPAELSEHPPYSPRDGAWLQKKVVDAVTQGKGYAETALVISYDETGGWGDHVVPYHSPSGTAGEWIQDPYNEVGYTYSGPGFRLPFCIISPWTRGGAVFTEHSDHNSQLLFVEEWLAAKGKNVTTNEMVPWRREHMSSLVNAFDFANPDYSIPSLPDAPAPHTDASGNYDGASYCESQHKDTRPLVPYDNQIDAKNVSSLSEQGFKEMRGAMTEGRFIVFEMGGYALTNPGKPAGVFTATKATLSHESIAQRWVVHNLVDGGNTFTISSARDGRYIGSHTALVNSETGAETYTVGFAAGKGYSLQKENGKYVTVDENGAVQIGEDVTYFRGYSVTYAS
ncbi:Non-hemolytic phospholipase C [Lachnellula hyalina]|uniref:Non-hemolytic phospholipase C n=1 Tax=Lachnellula hyalina TaxID=1316788 RepID=A0A8H8TYT1_9HELO|nr:Non-hemolytic phospholipase C [Lachnellula hyalina]TVY24206.1 Non-hemolytic phospholipase C [Lachnellula hyalina]